MTDDRSRLRKWLDKSMNGVGLDYIIKIDKPLEKNLGDLYTENRELYEQVRKRLRDYGMARSWRSESQTAGNNPHRARVGRTAGENGTKGHVIHKIDVNQGTRMFIIRYSDEGTGLIYVMLVGLLLASEREDHNEWRHEVHRIKQRFGGVVFDQLNEEDDDEIYEGGQVKDHNAGYEDQLDFELTPNSTSFGVTQVDTNITITYEQIKAIERKLPLVIDGHAGTGKSVIIAFRIALESINAYLNNETKTFLVIAYNRRVLNMVKTYAESWMKTLGSTIKTPSGEVLPPIPDHYAERVHYRTTLSVYRDLTKRVDYEAIPEPNTLASVSKFVNFFRFDHQFFSAPHRPRSDVSPEQAWHFIRGVLKGSGYGWRGDQVTLDDFGSINDGGRIPRKSTELMDKELIEKLLIIFNEYEQWRTETNSLDDLDLVRLATNALEAYENNDAEKSSYKGSEYFRNYDIVFVDEAQDLTIKEFDLLHKLLVDPTNARLVIGGDPLQTINPTGFTWEAISVFLWKILEKKFDFQRMLVSHRLSKTLVDFANVIIKKRHRHETGELQLMRASNEYENDSSSIIRIPVDIEDNKHQAKLEEFLTNSLGSNYGILIWARDKGERDDLIKRDPVLRKLAQLSGEKSEELTDRVILHSVESVKGLEFENVIFYRFGDLGQHFSELMSRANNPETDPSEKYTILYHLNRLFIAATRSKSNIYIFDSQENLDACWNENWWENTTSITSKLDTFVENVDMVPSLEIAEMFLDNAKENNDLNRASDALLVATKCPDSNERNMILREAEILKIRLELELYEYSNEDKKRKEERLVKLYKENGDSANAIQMMLSLKLWDDVQELISTSKLPDSPIIDFFKCMSALHTKSTGVSSLERILTRHRNLFSDQPPNLKSAFDQRIREHIKKYIREISSAALRALVDNWRYTKLDVIRWLKPDWKKGDPVACNKMKQEFEEKIRQALGDPASFNVNEYIEYLNILLNRPHVGEDEESNLLDRLSERGDYDAGKRRLRQQLIEADEWDFTSMRSRVYGHILTSIDNGTFRDDMYSSSNYEKIRPRLKFHRDYHQMRSYRALDWLKVLRKINSQDLTRNLTEGEGAFKSDTVPFQGLGEVWTNFSSNFLKLEEGILTQLKSNLLHRLYNHRATLRDFNSDMKLLQELLQYEAPHSLDVWSEGFKQLKITIETVNNPYDPNCIYLYCAALDEKTAKKLKPDLQRQFAYNLRDIILAQDDYSLMRENVNTIHGWVVKIMNNDHASQEVVIRIGLYRTYQKWKEDPDSFSDDEVESLLTNAKNYDAALYLILSEKTGKNVGQIAIDVYLRGFNTGEYESKEVIDAMANQDIEFNLNELPWLKAGQVSHVGDTYRESVEVLTPFNRLMYGATQDFNFNSALLSTDWNEEGSFSDERFFNLAEILHERAIRQTDLWGQEHQFWVEAARNDGILDWYKPRRSVDKEAFAVYAVFELILVLWKMTNKQRVAYLRKTWLPSLKSTSKKEETLDALFNLQIFDIVFSEAQHSTAKDLAREMLME